jgi:Zn-dependent peptidase ImmA (M78 family)
MTPDAFSRALNGQRAFSAIELARVADAVGADVHWLITGEPDPFRLVVAARHEYDAVTGSRNVPGFAHDEPVLADIGLAYQQAFGGLSLDPDAEVARGLPQTLAQVRTALGGDFVRPFVQRLENELDIDVVRVSELSTSYCFTTAGRHVIAVAATGNWFRENYSLAHELGHLVLGHVGAARSDHEREVNAFAAELLMPEAQLRAMDWVTVPAETLAERIWESGVSTDALSRRLRALGIACSREVGELLAQPTQRLLRHHGTQPLREDDSGLFFVVKDEITVRMEDAATRRFPKSLEEAHLDKIASGELGTGTLAWMLGIAPEQLEVETPDDLKVDLEDLAGALGL